jgi:hypothetical protein
LAACNSFKTWRAGAFIVTNCGRPDLVSGSVITPVSKSTCANDRLASRTIK